MDSPHILGASDPRGTVLCVDEDIAHSYKLTQTLKQAGYRVLSTHSVAAAVSTARSLSLDAVVVFGMYFNSGTTLRALTRELRADVAVVCIRRERSARRGTSFADVVVEDSGEAVLSALHRLLAVPSAAGVLAAAEDRR